jgi:hypothetical protein
MKFLLIIQICSILMQQCTDSIKMGTYDSHYDCATAGFIQGLSGLREFGKEYVDKNRMLVNFSCTPLETT